MCVAALGLTGTQMGFFAAGLALNAVNSFAQRAAAKDAADQTFQQGKLANKSAEDDKRQKQLALAEKKAEEEAAAKQNVFARNIETLKANKAIIASERSGTTIGLLLMDQDRQGANYQESIRQSLESMNRQYAFNIQSTETQYMNRRNEIQSNINKAYNKVPTLGQTLLSIGSGALTSYSNAAALPT